MSSSYSATFPGVTFGTIIGIGISRPVSRDNNFRIQSNTTTVTINTINETITTSNALQDLYPSSPFGTGSSFYGDLTINLANGTALISNGKAQLVNISFTNSTQETTHSIRNISYEFNVFEENSDIYINKIKNVSSINHSYTSSISEDSLFYDDVFSSSMSLPPHETSSSNGHSYTITRNISAVGIKVEKDSNNAYDNAKTAVDKIKDNEDILVRLNKTGEPYEYSYVETRDKSAGSYSLEEKYIFYHQQKNKKYKDSYSIDITEDNRAEGATKTVTINGTIKGFNTNNPSKSSPFTDNSFDNAETGWGTVSTKLVDRILPSIASGINPIELSSKIDYDKNKAIINYSYVYDNRPVSLVSGALSENLIVSDTHQNIENIHVPILQGPTSLHNMGTYNLPYRTATYSATFKQGVTIDTSKINNAIDQFDPEKLNLNPNGPLKSMTESSNTTEDVSKNSITKTKKWIYYIE